MRLLGKVHNQLVFSRRVAILAQRLASVVPTGARVLDVGCGDGSIDQHVLKLRPDLTIQGVDVLLRPNAKVVVTEFDGKALPFDDRSFDAVIFVDVLHHADDQACLLSEAARVTRSHVIVKDHVCDSAIDRQVLSFMDWVGNMPHGVRLPYNYLSSAGWGRLLGDVGLDVESYEVGLGLYPWPASMVFDRQLHFVAKLSPRRGAPKAAGSGLGPALHPAE